MKKKILFFIFDLGPGGAEKVLVNLVNNLDPNKYDITIKTIFSGGPNAKRLDSNIKFEPIFKCKPFGGIPKFLKLFPPSFLHKLFIRKKYDYEIAYLQHTPTRIIGGGKNKENVKKLAFVHTVIKSATNPLRVYRNRQEFIKIHNNFDKIGFVSEESLKAFDHHFSVSTPKYVVHNVNEYGNIKELSFQLIDFPISNSKINIISVGRLAPEKCLDRLIHSSKLLLEEGFSNWHIYLLGEGSEREMLENKIKDFNLQYQITLLGFQDNPYKYLSKMDLFVCSSSSEGYSTAATEAIYLGVPVLTTDCGGMHEIIGDSNAGIIVENSQDGLNEGLLRIFKELDLLPSLKEGAAIRSKDFSTEAGIREFESFLLS